MRRNPGPSFTDGRMRGSERQILSGRSPTQDAWLCARYGRVLLDKQEFREVKQPEWFKHGELRVATSAQPPTGTAMLGVPGNTIYVNAGNRLPTLRNPRTHRAYTAPAHEGTMHAQYKAALPVEFPGGNTRTRTHSHAPEFDGGDLDDFLMGDHDAMHAAARGPDKQGGAATPGSTGELVGGWLGLNAAQVGGLQAQRASYLQRCAAEQAAQAPTEAEEVDEHQGPFFSAADSGIEGTGARPNGGGGPPPHDGDAPDHPDYPIDAWEHPNPAGWMHQDDPDALGDDHESMIAREWRRQHPELGHEAASVGHPDEADSLDEDEERAEPHQTYEERVYDNDGEHDDVDEAADEAGHEDGEEEYDASTVGHNNEFDDDVPDVDARAIPATPTGPSEHAAPAEPETAAEPERAAEPEPATEAAAPAAADAAEAPATPDVAITPEFQRVTRGETMRRAEAIYGPTTPHEAPYAALIERARRQLTQHAALATPSANPLRTQQRRQLESTLRASPARAAIEAHLASDAAHISRSIRGLAEAQATPAGRQPFMDAEASSARTRSQIQRADELLRSRGENPDEVVHLRPMFTPEQREAMFQAAMRREEMATASATRRHGAEP